MKKSILTMVCLLALASAGNAAMLGGYAFDGTAGTATPPTVAEIGGNTALDLSLGSVASYNADTPFTYAGNTSLDVSGGTQARAANDTTNAYEFDLKNQAFSASVWVKFTEDAGWRQVVGQRKASTGNGWVLGIQSNEAAYLGVAGGGDARGVYGTTTLNDGVWHHIVAISDPNSDLDGLGDGELFLYIDGALEATYKKTLIASPTDYGNSSFSVGTQRDLSAGNINSFAGLIDEVAVFDTALTSSEVTALYTGSIVPEPGTLVLLGIGGVVAMIRRRR